MTPTPSRNAVAMLEFRSQLEERSRDLVAALPSHIRFDYFQRAAVTAVQYEPKLLDVERRSLFNALMRCAQDGLIPDGRQAALVIFKHKDRGPIAQYFQMIGGIRKLVQQSGEITRFDQQIVYAADQFDFELGDAAFIRHKPALQNRGAPILVYSIAQYRDGTMSREVMTVDEVEKVRAVSRNADGDPWRRWWGEMARKTVARRHAKVLPMSSDTEAAVRRGDDIGIEDMTRAPSLAPPQGPSIGDAFDQLAANGDSVATGERRTRRGRPSNEELAERRRQQAAAADAINNANDPGDDFTEIDPATGEVIERREYSAADAGGPVDQAPPPSDDPDDTDADFRQGVADARAGRKACIHHDINRDDRRLTNWRRGFMSATEVGATQSASA